MKKLHVSIILTILCLGCTTHIPQIDEPRKEAPLPDDVLSKTYFEISDLQFTQDLLEKDSDFTSYACKVTSTIDAPLSFKYLKSHSKPDIKHPVILLYNILKDKKEIVPHLLAYALLEEGYDCIIVQQEWLLGKGWLRPIVPDTDSPHLSYDEYNARMVRNVGRIIKGWIPAQKGLSGQFGFIGVSLGGIQVIGAAALFQEATLTVTIMAGGGTLDLFNYSEEGLVISNRRRLLEVYKKKYETDAEAKLREDILNLKFEPLKLAKCIDTSKIKMMITTDDTSVPTRNQWKLFYALGGPEALVFHAGHYSMALYYFTIKDQLIDWLGEAFKN